jgi:hypothetical protein
MNKYRLDAPFFIHHYPVYSSTKAVSIKKLYATQKRNCE